MDFGKHEGYRLSEIYHYDPSYIVWMIKNINYFEIDINEFINLPKPTVYYNPVELKPNRENFVEVFSGPGLNASIEEIKKSKKLKEIDFEFSKEVINILEEKKKKRPK